MDSSLATEYGLNGNGHSNGNGNGHSPKFGIVPAKDPTTQAILDSRDSALRDKRLSKPERAFVCFVIDRTLHPKYFDPRGVTCMADSIPANVFGVTTRTVYAWRHNPSMRDYFWLTKTRRPGTWGMMVYHLTALHPAPKENTEWKDGAGGVFAGGSAGRELGPDTEAAARGREIRNAALAVKRAQKNLPLSGGFAVVTGSPVAPPVAESADLQAFSADGRNNFRPTAETNFGGPPKLISADGRNEFRRSAETNFGGGPKLISAVGRNSPPPTAEANLRHIETQKEPEKVLKEGGEAVPPPAPHPEMVFWEGKWWFESKLHRQLKLLEEGISQADGDGRKRLKERRHGLLVALGVAIPKASPAQTRRLETALAKQVLLPPADLAKWISGMRDAAR